MQCAEYFIARRDLHYTIPQWDALHFDHRVTYLRGASAVAAGVDPTLHAAASLLANADDDAMDGGVADESSTVEWIDVEAGAA